MKINSLEVYNAHSKLRINQINFDDFTLLVGASGVGKTQILRSLVKLRTIASGKSISGFQWTIEFEIEGRIYKWDGAFETQDSYDEMSLSVPFIINESEKPEARIVRELVTVDGETLINRNGDDIIYKDNKTVKLSLTESVIHLLREEDDISIIHRSLSKIILVDPNEGVAFYPSKDKDFNEDGVYSIKDVRETTFSINAKLYLCQQKQPEYFNSIVESYKGIFPFVEDVKIEKIENDAIPKIFARHFILRVKERGIDSWIPHSSMSSGMIKTFMQIAHIHLSPRGTVFLIDEFENGFGVNCINDITDILIHQGGEVQFIITSHHPYIINNIPLDNWKIISRKAGIVDNYTANDFNLHESNHEAFTKLINLDVYVDGADK